MKTFFVKYLCWICLICFTQLSETKAQSNRYFSSALIQKGQAEVKVFNNLYTQQTGDGNNLLERATFFTILTQALYGINSRLSVGFDARVRGVRYASLPNSAFSVFAPVNDGERGRWALTALAPKVKFLPAPNIPFLSIQTAVYIPTGRNLSTPTYIDWDGWTWWTQIFYDRVLNNRFSLFLEADLLWENIGKGSLVRLPLKGIFSYFPNQKITLYAMGEFAPSLNQPPFDFYAQAGLGAKYQFSWRVEIEALYTWFTNRFLLDNKGKASTLNLGLRLTLN